MYIRITGKIIRGSRIINLTINGKKITSSFSGIKRYDMLDDDKFIYIIGDTMSNISKFDRLGEFGVVAKNIEELDKKLTIFIKKNL